MAKKKRERKGDLTAKDIATMLAEQNEDLNYTPEDFGIFAQITTMFEDGIVEAAIKQYPREGDKQRVGAYLMSICKSVAKSSDILKNANEQVPNILGSMDTINRALSEGKC